MVKITDLLGVDTIIIDLQSSTKEGVIQELVEKLHAAGKLVDHTKFQKAILAREAQSTTGIGEGIAIPHAKSSSVAVPALAFGHSRAGVDYDSLDGQPAHLFFMIAASEGANQDHLETLSRLSTLLMNPDFRHKIEHASSPDAVIQVIDEQERLEEKDRLDVGLSDQATEKEAVGEGKKAGQPNGRKDKASDQEKEEGSINHQQQKVDKGKILAVTACPTGIAHTYMAADALKAKAKELGVEIKVQTNGSGGVKNKLSEADIQEARAIIVAADTKVDMADFRGKHVLEVPVAQAIRQPQKLIEKALSQNAPVYRGYGSSTDVDHEQKKRGNGEGKGFYKHLMNGVSNMLPFVVGGGILIAISFIFGINASDPADPSYHPIAEALMTIGGGNAFGLMIPVLAGFIAMSIADRPGFAPGMVGGLLASTGEAGFLGGLIAGFLAGYVVLGLKRLCSRMPQALEGIKPVLIYPLFGILITGLVMMYVINEPVKAINDWMEGWLGGLGSGNLVLLGLILGGMMAVDMGGPINKAAFTFGIAMIDAGNYAPHAAIMAGGMVPPLGLALATTLFKRKFTKAEREAGKTNYVMGATFITEGAIPFAAADPGRVIPSIVTGSAVAGALTMLFSIGLPAPHGGLFVIPIVEGNPLLYVLSIVIGSILTACMVGFLKKEVKE